MLMIKPNNGARAEDMALAAAEGWLLSQDVLAGDEIDEAAFMDEHGLDLQRGYNMLCHIVGSDAEGWVDLADDLEYDDDRVDFCVEEFADRSDDWRRALAHGSREQSRGRFVLRFGEAATDETGRAKEIVRSISDLPTALDDLGRKWSPGRTVPVTFQDCDGDANAWWDPETKALTLCYELIGEFELLFSATE